MAYTNEENFAMSDGFEIDSAGKKFKILKFNSFICFIIILGDKMRKKLNKRGFSLVELLAVLVILSAIMGIALPSITSSMERNKGKQDEDWDKVVLIPIKTETDSNGNITSVKSNLDMESASLKGGEKDLIKMQVLYTTF